MVLKPLIQRVASFDTRVPVVVKPGPDVTIEADADQLEQLLINLLRNAADANLEVGGGTVKMGWRRTARRLEICGGRRRAGAVEYVEPVRAVFHDEAGRLGHRPGAVPARSPKVTGAR